MNDRLFISTHLDKRLPTITVASRNRRPVDSLVRNIIDFTMLISSNQSDASDMKKQKAPFNSDSFIICIYFSLNS